MLLGIAGMFRAPPDARVAAGHQALALPDLPAPSARPAPRCALSQPARRRPHRGGEGDPRRDGRGRCGERRRQLGVRVGARRDRHRLCRRALPGRARHDRAGGERRHRRDRLGARAPRAGVALRDADRAGPRGRLTAAGRRRHRGGPARPERLGHPHLRDLARAAAAPAGPARRRRRDPRRTVQPRDRRSVHRRPRRRGHRRPGASRAASGQSAPAATNGPARTGASRGQHAKLPPRGGVAARPADDGRRRSRGRPRVAVRPRRGAADHDPAALPARRDRRDPARPYRTRGRRRRAG